MADFLGFKLGDPSRPMNTAATESREHAQPNSRPLGNYTGVPPQTSLRTMPVTPTVNSTGQRLPATQIVPTTRENRFVTLTAPPYGATIYVGGSDVSPNGGFGLPPGQPYEIPLPGNQGLWAVTDAPTFLNLRVQIAAALAGDLERRM
jgi:hypothetical protein